MFGLTSCEHFSLNSEFREIRFFHYNIASCVQGGQKIQLVKKICIV